MAYSSHIHTPANDETLDEKLARLRPRFVRFVPKGVTLTSCQQRFVDLFFEGNSLCLVGSAGTGKSFIIKLLFEFLERHDISVGRSALTGVAAFGIGGQTIHSFLGLGLADEHLESLIDKIKVKGKVKARIRALEVLFIDEVSMAKGDLINKIDGVLKYFRYNDEPWGGVRVVFLGDPLQLLAVFKTDDKVELFFQSKAWEESGIKMVTLNEIMRQKKDDVFVKILNAIRVGDTSSLHLLDGRIGATFPDDGIEAVRIFCHNVDVAQYNEKRLAEIDSPVKTFFSRDNGQEHHIESFNKNCPAPEKLDIKIGAQVMLVANIDQEEGYVNGSVGVVRSFTNNGVNVRFAQGSRLIERNQWEIKEQIVGTDGKIKYHVVATRNQIPLRLAWASTVHKCQGMTLDRAIIDMNSAFAYGQVYTSLSRVRDINSLSIVGSIPHAKVKVHPECVEFYRRFGTETTT